MNATEVLISAIRSLNVDTVEKLIKSDLEIECGNGVHHSLLHIALELIASEITNLEIDLIVYNSETHLNPLCRYEAFQRIIEVLLASGRCNVDALSDFCQTALHLVIHYFKCLLIFSYDYEDLVNAIIKILLKNNANINAKTSIGETPLMKASELGCSHIVQLLLDWRSELGVGVDLNARDIYGETALIKAAKSAHADVVELLLKHGCSDEFQDHRGFYALHAVIYGPDLINDPACDFFQPFGLCVSENTIKVLDRYGEKYYDLGRMISDNLNRNNDIQRIVRMLVTFGRSNVNSLNFRGNTVLDVALKSKQRVTRDTVDMLMEFGTSSCVAMYSENLKNTIQTVEKLRTVLHRLLLALNDTSAKCQVSAKNLLNSSLKQLIEAFAVTKDQRGRLALHYAAMTQIYLPDDVLLLIPALKLSHIFNERDNYGRTPLHYCQNEDVYKSLVKQGADENIQDIDGATPKDLRQLRENEPSRHNLPVEVIEVLPQLNDDELKSFESNNDEYNVYESKDDESKKKVYKDDEYKESTDDKRKLEDKSIPRKADVWMIWRDSKYAYRDQFSTIMREKVKQFMQRLSDEIRKKDPRFECRPVLIGSAEEGTKTGLPDEFDFNFILTRLSELCEVVPSPEAPSGFVHLKRRSCISECRPTSECFPGQEGFNRLFSSNGFLLTMEIASRFRILYLQVMSEPGFWNGENVFEWDTWNEIGLAYLKEEDRYDDFKIPNDFRSSVHLCSTIQLKLSRPIEGRYVFKPISVDIVPCIHQADWWPENALQGVSDEIKLGGCHLVFDQPHIRYPWVPFSDPYARISFAPAESRIIKQCSAVARAAYMVGKHLVYYYRPKLKFNFTYVLKTCLLYCREALNYNTGNVLLYEDIDPWELRYFVEKLMLCFHEFYLQDFLPCYLMPSFHLPIEEYLKSNHDKLLNDSSFRYPLLASKLYDRLCATESPVNFCSPTAEPLNEKFNREELIRKLSMNTEQVIILRPSMCGLQSDSSDSLS